MRSSVCYQLPHQQNDGLHGDQQSEYSTSFHQLRNIYSLNKSVSFRQKLLSVTQSAEPRLDARDRPGYTEGLYRNQEGVKAQVFSIIIGGTFARAPGIHFTTERSMF